MSKKQFKSQASSSRAVSGAFGTPDGGLGTGAFGAPSAFGAVSSSPLSYIYEPPDLGAISEPSIVVAFKNLQKKDSTTKAKALEELQAYVVSLKEAQQGVEEAILEAWIKIYPRTSIDNARRVRQLAHLVQGHISVSCGKRIAKSLPSLVGPWLAGLYDVDRNVTRATQESIEQTFPSEEKRTGLWRLYRKPIITFCLDAITKESVRTLSDERTTSPDDALAKHARVVGASILLVANALEKYPSEKAQNQDDALDDFLAEGKVWELASHSDAYVRRAVYRLLVAAIANREQALKIEVISVNVLILSLHIDQTGSAFDYARALASLTKYCPQVWTQYYSGSGKKSAMKRLQQFLKKGSQGGPPEYWGHISSIMGNIPQEVFASAPDNRPEEKKAPKAVASQSAILQAVLSALRSRDEPSRNLAVAWSTYLDVFSRLQTTVDESTSGSQLLEDFVLPVVLQYVKPSPRDSEWTIARLHESRLSICVKAFLLIWNGAQELLRDRWTNLSKEIVEDIKISLPEQSKDWLKSQNLVSDETGKWFSLEGAVLKRDTSDSIKALFESTSYSVLNAAIESTRSRHGKPSASMATLVAALQFTPQIVYDSPELKTMLFSFVQEDSPKVMLTPSVPYFFTILDLLQGQIDVSRPYQAGLKVLKEAPDSPEKSRALATIFSSPFLARGGNDEALQSLMSDVLVSAMSGHESHWVFVQTALRAPAAPADLIDNCLTTLVDSLDDRERTLGSLEGLNMAVKGSGDALKAISTSNVVPKLLSRLLYLAETPDEGVASQARSLTLAIEGSTASEDGSTRSTKPILGMIRSGLDTPTASSLPIQSIVEQARKLFKEAKESDKTGLVSQLLPSVAQWKTALSLETKASPNGSLAITNPLSTAMIAIQSSSTSAGTISSKTSRDAHGFSAALRLAWYTVRLFKMTDILLHATDEEKQTSCRSIALVLHLAADDLSIPGGNSLWDAATPEVEAQIVDLIAEAQGLFASWLQAREDFIPRVQEDLLQGCHGSSTSSYYSARAYSAITSELKELHGESASSDDQDLVQDIRKSKSKGYETLFREIAVLASASESNPLTRLANELVADLTGHDFQKSSEHGLRLLLCLNCINYSHEDIVAGIPKPRLVFFVKSVVSALDNVGSTAIPVEIVRALTVVLPCVQETYDGFWSQILAWLPKLWSSLSFRIDDEVALLHGTLKLLAMLRRLVAEESNDDLVDAWKESEASMGNGLINLLQLLRGFPDESHQPRKTTNTLLARQVIRSSSDSMSSAAELYPVIASDSLALQSSAYNILHGHIPKQQEQVSLDKALTKKYDAQLPEELLSLIVTPPEEDTLAEASFERSMPAFLRSYLLSWKLVYDHWTNASYPVQSDYTKSLTDGAYLKNLLDLTFRFLITDRFKPVDASKFDLMKLPSAEGESPETETQHFLVHLYFLSLSCLPNLTKSWWRDSTSRQTMIAVESWTEKYISPLIIANELTAVSKWGPSQADADQPLSIKVSHTTHEITAAIPVDEQTMSIAIRLPPSYPLSRATVESVHRVGVDEKKWRSWLITTQGVINFSSEGGGGSLIEGLLAWRKNVTATLKGQTECSICYSVVSAERQLPSKRCGTCRNMFHGGCLYRWFKSSNSSSCPLCRNAFNYS